MTKIESFKKAAKGLIKVSQELDTDARLLAESGNHKDAFELSSEANNLMTDALAMLESLDPKPVAPAVQAQPVQR